MRLKSYFAATVEGAVNEARKELGDEALLVNSRKAPPEARHLGEYEVIFAAAQNAAAVTPAPVPEPLPSIPGQPWERIVQEVADLRRQVERTASTLNRSAALANGGWGQEAEWADALAELVSADILPELAHEIVEGARRRTSPEAAAPGGLAGKARPPVDPDRLRAALTAEISARFGVDATLGRPGAARRVVALVGPPGTGKTTTLVKLAATSGLTARRPAQILSVDTARIAAAEQLRVCAGILGVGFQVLETTRALVQALEEHRHKELILIDTPGLGPKDMDNASELAQFLATDPEIDTHLVLTATTKTVDLTRAVERFDIFRPRKLLFTRLDETETYGAILNQAARTGTPLSFLAAGQQIPEDLEPANRERVVDLLSGRMPAIARAAA
jgi:flagellar biosynthesis protein FlhF